MIFTQTLNTKDKVRSLSILLEEIEHASILKGENKNSKIEHLKSVCYEIDWHINQSIEFAKTNYLREERIALLIGHGKRLKIIQKAYENELIKLGSERDLENEYEINSAFDFDLKPLKEITLLDDANDIEKRIRTEIKESDIIRIENKYSNVFANDKAYELFLELHEEYKDKGIDLANYSFLFYAMSKDKLIVCRGINFIKFLIREFDVSIEKIDARQSGINHKQSIYNNIKTKVFGKK